MEPFKIMTAMLRDPKLTEIGGAPQVGKVYRSGTSELFGVNWPSEKGKPHYQGKELTNSFRPPVRFIDPDTAETLDELPANLPSFNDDELSEDFPFVDLCYEDRALRETISFYSRQKLRKIFQDVAYKRLLKETEKKQQNQETEINTGEAS
jgi:hypothetical protein